jgi:hypothetical protein
MLRAEMRYLDSQSPYIYDRPFTSSFEIVNTIILGNIKLHAARYTEVQYMPNVRPIVINHPRLAQHISPNIGYSQLQLRSTVIR